MMGKYIRRIILLITGVWAFALGSADNFRINQLGYYPQANKIVPIMRTGDSTFVLVNANGEIVYSGSLSKAIRWSRIGDSTKLADFSSFTKIGTYWMKITDIGISMPIHIRANVFYEASLASLKTFYYQRASMQIEEKYGGRFARETAHPDTLCYFHASSGHDSGTASSPGGWYDAGDFGKYVVNAGVTLGNMFFFHENFGEYFGDSILNIPESKNGIDDLLDEIKYELDWLLTMQDDDGGVFHKLTTLRHAGIVMPEKDVAKRYFIGKSTSATLNFAAVMAMAARVYKKIIGLEEYSDTCIARAKLAYAWATVHPEEYVLENPSGINTGVYEDDELEDEFLWAASELFITTGEQVYRDSVKIDELYYSYPASWKEPGYLAPLSLGTIAGNLDSQSLATVRAEIKNMADTYLKQIAAHAFRIPSANYYYWGSNGVFANAALFLLAAFKVTNDTAYARGAAEIADYLLGKNAPAISFVTGYGIYRSEHPHHRQSMADTVADPIPGFLMGGPNGSPSEYTDDEGAYDKNEVAINWNAPLSGLLAALNKIFGVNECPVVKEDYYVISTVQGDGSVTVNPEKLIYSAGDSILFSAIPREKQLFFGWLGMGGILSTDTAFTLAVSRDMKVTALFGNAGDLVINGDFSKTISREWNRPAGSTRLLKNGVCVLTITDPGTETWSVQLVQNNIPLYEGREYVFQFDARSDGARTIYADVAKNGGDYSSYMGTAESCSLTAEMKHFKYHFLIQKTSDLSARITFNCGLDSLPVYIDNVSLKIYDSTTAPVVFQPMLNRVDEHLKFTRKDGRISYTVTVVDPSKARFEVFDLNGKVQCSLTHQIRLSGSGKTDLVMDNRMASGLCIIRYFDGKRLFVRSLATMQR
ncbi:MAG: glycoside hydrolase family 9 protein [Chitinispirillaceae bacterium]|nr:glycoside hydrolase family 9 protein [Chitinispirillaceae bacterium]